MPKQRTLEEFIRDRKLGSLWPVRSYVKHPGFSSLYVRLTKRFLGGNLVEPVLDIASLEAKKPGRGAFTELHNWLRKEFPELWIYIEIVHNERFREKLLRMGYTLQKSGESFCYYMPPEGPQQETNDGTE